MKKILLALFLAFSLFPMSSSFSQEKTDTEPTLGIVLTSFSPFNYKDDDGTTIILGEVENTKSFPVSGIKIWAGFYDDFSENPLETTIGTTLLEVIPPFAKSPYMIKSPSPNSAITSVSVNLLGFNSSPEKNPSLNLDLGNLQIDERISLSGTVTNNGELNSTDTKIHLISYDTFVPPRILGVETFSIANDLESGDTSDFQFDVQLDSRAVSFKIVAESRDYSTGLIDITHTPMEIPTKIVSISNISVTDMEGNRMSSVSVGSSINIQSELSIQYFDNQESEIQPYVYWVQIKQSVEVAQETKSFVEFIGKTEGTFATSGEKLPQVEWTPQNEGLYFIETFVWDPMTIPLASKGPISLVLVN